MRGGKRGNARNERRDVADFSPPDIAATSACKRKCYLRARTSPVPSVTRNKVLGMRSAKENKKLAGTFLATTRTRSSCGGRARRKSQVTHFAHSPRRVERHSARLLRARGFVIVITCLLTCFLRFQIIAHNYLLNLSVYY